MRTTLLLPSLLSIALAAASCGNADKNASCGPNPASYSPRVVAAEFSSTIDNKYLPYRPGTAYKHVDSDGNIVETTVLSETKVIMGVTCVVVHDTNKTPAGHLNEDTFDYYAQDKDGNVWYFGEDTKAYVGDQVSTEGTWKAGESCALPGIVMLGSPRVGDHYRQEYLPGHAEDEAEVVSLTETVTVPYGTFTNCIETKEHTALAPGDVENKYYCPGLGEVLAHDIGTIDAGKREQLISINGRTSP
jgi:hypothetical protein